MSMLYTYTLPQESINISFAWNPLLLTKLILAYIWSVQQKLVFGYYQPRSRGDYTFGSIRPSVHARSNF